MKSLRNVKDGIRDWMVLALILVILAILPLLGVPRFPLLFLYLVFLYYTMASMWNLLASYCGLISLCQPAFIGLAGYSLAVFGWLGLPFYMSLAAAVAVTGVFATIISIPLLRLKGMYFAIATLILTETLRIIFLTWRPEGIGGTLQGGASGYTILGARTFSNEQFYWMALAVAIICVVIVWKILRSKLGLGLMAIRDSDDTASSSGVNVFSLKLGVFVIGAIVTGLAGAIFYALQGYIEPYGAFSIKWTMIIVLATIVGGVRTEFGPVVGAVIFTILHFWLAKYGTISLLLQGVILIVIMLLMPEGIVGVFINKYKLKLVTMWKAL